MNISVIGSGSWGLAVATLLHSNGHKVRVWSFLEKEAEELRLHRKNEKLLPGVHIHEDIEITTDIACAEGCDILVLAVPSFGVADTAEKLSPYIKEDTICVLLSKGFDEKNNYSLFSETLEQKWQRRGKIVALTGPSHAEEVARGIPTAVVAACEEEEPAKTVQLAFAGASFRVYTSRDIISAELGGAMKNIMALAAGISDGYGFGDNTKALIMTRGIAEMSRLGVHLGGKAETFAGLSGVGDLIVTCISQHSRNRRAGLLIGQGYTAEEAMEKVGSVVEGYYATKAIHEKVKDDDIELPICNVIYELLFTDLSVEQGAKQLLARDKKPESDSERGI